MAIRVIAWGMGYLGKQGLRQIIGDPALELVGLHVSGDDKRGRDAGEIAGTGPTGVVATSDSAELLALGADCLVYFASTVGRDDQATAEILPFLEAGTDVVSISHFDLQYPAHGDPHHVGPIVAACERGGSSFLLTGEEPGFAFGQQLFAILSTIARLDGVRIVEMSDVQGYGGTDSLLMYGFNGDPAVQPPMFTSQVGASWHIATLRGIADFLGLTVDDIEQHWDAIAVDYPIDTAAFGTVQAGRTAATRWRVTVHCLGRPMIRYEKILRLHHGAAPEWERPALATGAGVTHKIFVEGAPEVSEELHRPRGASATPTIAVNAIPFVHAAPPGVLTQMDIRLFPPRQFGTAAVKGESG